MGQHRVPTPRTHRPHPRRRARPPHDKPLPAHPRLVHPAPTAGPDRGLDSVRPSPHPHAARLRKGTYESGFPDEYAFEDWLYRLENLAEDEQALSQGEHVSGPAADAYRYRVTAAGREFAGRVLTSDRQARDLLGNQLLQIHHGMGMTCVLNPQTAACQLRGAVDDPTVTPDTDDCRPQCVNLARTDRDIAHVEQQARHLAEIVADPLAPLIRHAREQHELTRLKQIIEAHEKGRGQQ